MPIRSLLAVGAIGLVALGLRRISALKADVSMLSAARDGLARDLESRRCWCAARSNNLNSGAGVAAIAEGRG